MDRKQSEFKVVCLSDRKEVHHNLTTDVGVGRLAKSNGQRKTLHFGDSAISKSV